MPHNEHDLEPMACSGFASTLEVLSVGDEVALPSPVLSGPSISFLVRVERMSCGRSYTAVGQLSVPRGIAGGFELAIERASSYLFLSLIHCDVRW